DAPGDFRERPAHELAVPVAQRLEPRVDLPAPPASADDLPELVLAGRADRHPEPVVREDLEPLGVVDRLAARQRVGPAGVVSDHSAERTMIVRLWIGPEGQAVRLCGVAQRVANRPGKNARETTMRVELDDPVHVLAEVEHHRRIAALSGETRPA